MLPDIQTQLETSLEEFAEHLQELEMSDTLEEKCLD